MSALTLRLPDDKRSRLKTQHLPIHRINLRAAWWDNPTMILTLDAKRRLTVPAALAPASPFSWCGPRAA